MTAPRQRTASYSPERARWRATSGISHAPGTQATVISPSGMPALTNVSVAPASSFPVILSLYLETTMAYLPSAEPLSPRKIWGMKGAQARLNANKCPLEGVKDADQFRLRGALADVNSDSSTMPWVVIDWPDD